MLASYARASRYPRNAVASIALAALLCVSVSGCCCSGSREHADLVVAFVIYAPLALFAAAIVYVIVRMFRKARRRDAIRATWFPTALLGRTQIPVGAPAGLLLQCHAGTPCSLWVSLRFQGEAWFRLDVSVQQGSEIITSVSFDGYEDGEDFGLQPSAAPGSPNAGFPGRLRSNTCLVGFATPDGAYIRRVLDFSPPHPAPTQLSVRLTPTRDTAPFGGEILVLVGEPPD